MKNPLNGHARLVAVVTIIVGVCSILSAAAAGIAVWNKKVSDAVLEQRMVNEHDATLKEMVPKFALSLSMDTRQEADIADLKARDAERDRIIYTLTGRLDRTNDLLQLLTQGMMKHGEIQR